MVREQYYIVIRKGQKAGPFSKEELLNKIKPDTLIWHEGLDSWKKASEIEQVNSILNALPPPLPKDKSFFSVTFECIILYKYIIFNVTICLLFFYLMFFLFFGGLAIDHYEKTYFSNEKMSYELQQNKSYSLDDLYKLTLKQKEKTDAIAKFTLLEYLLDIGNSSWLSSRYYYQDFIKTKQLIYLLSSVGSIILTFIYIYSHFKNILRKKNKNDTLRSAKNIPTND